MKVEMVSSTSFAGFDSLPTNLSIVTAHDRQVYGLAVPVETLTILYNKRQAYQGVVC
jgi:hypothetical protein